MPTEPEAPQTDHPRSGSFAGLPVVTDWNGLEADAVIFGVPHGKPYDPALFPNDQSTTPVALREASPRIVMDHDYTDADGDGLRLADMSVVDGGDIPFLDGDIDRHYADAERAVRFAVGHGILPVTVGGDDGVTNPVLRGLDGLSDVTLVQIDAHLDWRHERHGEADGYSSPMRRASELPHIAAIHQIGIRSYGSARESDLNDALNWGAHIHLARDIHQHGIEPVVENLPEGGRFFVTLDVDGLDPAVMPGTLALAPGGLDWWQTVGLFKKLASKGDIVGLNVVELAPKNDINQLSLIGAGRLILKLLALQLVKPSTRKA